jgi:uncharacterized protein (DUF302 family)
MNNFYSRKLSVPFDQALSRLKDCLFRRGFGIITSVDLKDVFKQRLDVEFRKYVILGACNPQFAYKAVSLESHVGSLLPCNVVVQQHENGEVEISAVNPMDMIDKMMATPSLAEVAREVSARLREALDDLHREIVGAPVTEALPRTLD